MGTTHFPNVEISSGEHRIGVEKDGFESYSKQIVFEKGRTKDLYVILDRKTLLKCRLYVNTQPDDARVRILNIGPAFDQGMELNSGRYHVEVSANGYDTKKLWVTLGAGEDKDMDIRLKKSADKAVSFSSSSGYTGTRIIGRHDQFIAYANGVVNVNIPILNGLSDLTETQTGMMLKNGLRI